MQVDASGYNDIDRDLLQSSRAMDVVPGLATIFLHTINFDIIIDCDMHTRVKPLYAILKVKSGLRARDLRSLKIQY